jgi:LmbE family N-acetylglucosaminyl deacetylase
LRSITLSLIAAVLLSAAYAISKQKPEPPTPPPAPAAPFPTVDASTSLLVVAPHPDDEVLCCAGVIQRVLKAGGRATVVWLTSGDASEMDLLVIEKSLFLQPQKLRDLAARRTEEARSAATLLGIPPEQQIFLGYPDRGVMALLTDHYTTPYFSKYSGSSTVPYDSALGPGHPYTGVSLEHDFEAVVQRVRPTLVLAPSPRDSHPDHEAAGILTMRALSRRDELSRARYWIVHGGEPWPMPRGYHPTRAQSPPPRSKGLSLASFELTSEEQERKLQALRAYQTQMRVMSSFLLAFVRKTELYSDNPMPEPAHQP